MSAGELARRWVLVAPFHDRALRVARTRTRSWSDAEDLANEALIRAVRVPELAEATLPGLISTITIRLATDLHRREAAARRLEGRCAADPSGELGEEVCDRSEATWLSGQLAHLKANEREVILHRAAGHTVASTAQGMGMTYKAVESAYTRARVQLRKSWQATLGAILFGSAGLRRVVTRSQPVLTVQTAAWFTLCLVAPLIATIDVPRPSQSLGDDGIVVTDPVPAWTAGARGLPRAAAKLKSVRHDRTVASVPPDGTTIVRTGPVGDQRVVQGGASVERRDPDRPFLEQVGDCVDNGVIVRPDYIDCAPDPS